MNVIGTNLKLCGSNPLLLSIYTSYYSRIAGKNCTRQLDLESEII